MSAIANAANVRLGNPCQVAYTLERAALSKEGARLKDKLGGKFRSVFFFGDVSEVVHAVVCPDAISVVGEVPRRALSNECASNDLVNFPSRVLAIHDYVQAWISIFVQALLQNLGGFSRPPGKCQRPYLAIAGNLVSPLTAHNRAPFRHDSISFQRLGYGTAQDHWGQGWNWGA